MKALIPLIFSLFISGCAGKFMEKGGLVYGIGHTPSATIINRSGYQVLGRSDGESSTFYLLGMFPVTRPLSIDYALNQAVQKIKGGQSMVNISVWHESHFYFPLGRVSVLKVEGDVVSFREEIPEAPEKKEPAAKTIKGRNRR